MIPKSGCNKNSDEEWTLTFTLHAQDKIKVTNVKMLPKMQLLIIFNKLNKQITFSSWLIRCVKMKWIWQALWKIQSGHDSVHRWMDRWTRWNQYTPLQIRWSVCFMYNNDNDNNKKPTTNNNNNNTIYMYVIMRWNLQVQLCLKGQIKIWQFQEVRPSGHCFSGWGNLWWQTWLRSPVLIIW